MFLPPMADHDQHHGSHHPHAVLDGEQLVAVVAVGGVEQPPRDPHHDVVDGVAVLALGLEHVAGRDQQDQAEQVEHPGERTDQRGAEKDEPGPRDQGEHDAEQQHLLLISPGHPGTGDDDEEHEQVVDR